MLLSYYSVVRFVFYNLCESYPILHIIGKVLRVTGSTWCMVTYGTWCNVHTFPNNTRADKHKHKSYKPACNSVLVRIWTLLCSALLCGTTVRLYLVYTDISRFRNYIVIMHPGNLLINFRKHTFSGKCRLHKSMYLWEMYFIWYTSIFL